MSSDIHRQLAEELITEAEKWDGIQAGMAPINRVLKGPSYRATTRGKWQGGHAEQTMQWLPNAISLLVLALHHSEDDLQLDWFDRGDSAGNRQLTIISKSLVAWLFQSHGVRAQALPYRVEHGGVYLKDAAVFAGLGVVGKNNMLLNPNWGPNLRLRSVLIEGNLIPSAPLENFDPCYRCTIPCQKVCPENAFDQGQYNRPPCMQHLELNRANPIEISHMYSGESPIRVIEWCRRCEFACPVGAE